MGARQEGPAHATVGAGGISNQGELRTLPQEVSKQTADDWKDSAAEYVRSDLFSHKQFVFDEDLVLNGRIQKLVCNGINIAGVDRARLFWEEKGGKVIVRNTFRRKRQAAQNAMKLAFRGKFNFSYNVNEWIF